MIAILYSLSACMLSPYREASLTANGKTWSLDLARSPLWQSPQPTTFHDFWTIYSNADNFPGVDGAYEIRQSIRWSWVFQSLFLSLWLSCLAFGSISRFYDPWFQDPWLHGAWLCAKALSAAGAASLLNWMISYDLPGWIPVILGLAGLSWAIWTLRRAIPSEH